MEKYRGNMVDNLLLGYGMVSFIPFEISILNLENLHGVGGYLHVVNGKGGKQRTSIHPKPPGCPGSSPQGSERRIHRRRADQDISLPDRSRGC
jgi:hypothetical protein